MQPHGLLGNFSSETVMEKPRLVKQDTFGSVAVAAGGEEVVRDTRKARPWARWLAKRLARREAHALRRLEGLDGVPQLLAFDGQVLRRTFIDGVPMYEAKPEDARYFREGLRILRRMHRRGVVHNDLAKEPNWLQRPDGLPAILDFQLAQVRTRRSRWFRQRAREDLRYWLKHKRTYRAQALTRRQRQMLARPAWPSRLWQRTGKPVYLFVTRRILHWADREGAMDRGRPRSGG